MATVGRLSFIEDKILDHLSFLIDERIPEACRIILFGSRASEGGEEYVWSWVA